MQRHVAAFIFLTVLFLTPMAQIFAQEENPVAPEVSAKASGKPSGEGALRPLKEEERPIGAPSAIKLLGAAAATLASILAFWATYRHFRKKIDEKQIPPPPEPPEKAAYEALKGIRELMDSDGKAFYFRLCLVFREYIGGRFFINAAEMTTEELLPVLRSLPLERNLASDASLFLSYSDPVKYAEAVAERTKMERHFKFVRHFVKKTTDAISPEKDRSGQASQPETATSDA